MERERRESEASRGRDLSASNSKRTAFNINSAYKLLIPNEKFNGLAFAYMLFADNNLFKYEDMVNAYVEAPSSTHYGNSLFYFTDRHDNYYLGYMSAKDFKILLSNNVKQLAISDIAKIRDVSEGKTRQFSATVLDLYFKGL